MRYQVANIYAPDLKTLNQALLDNEKHGWAPTGLCIVTTYSNGKRLYRQKVIRKRPKKGNQ